MIAARIAGLISVALVAALTLGTLVVVAVAASGPARLGAGDWAAIRFTVEQAVRSSVISAAIAVPAARALARRRFWGRRFLLTLLGAPFILPVIVAILGLLAVFGRAGLVNQVLVPLGLGPVNIYGLSGVVLAHVFFNLPLATRLILQGWSLIPAERFRLAAQLGMEANSVFRHLEIPMLRAVLPGVLTTVFLLCLTSFAVALTLGGGPRATTIELAIYQAFRFDFNLSKAALLALVQFALSATTALAAWSVARPAGHGSGLGRPVHQWSAARPVPRVLDALVLGMVSVFLLAPLAMVAVNGASGLGDLPYAVWPAAGRSLVVALASALVTLLLGLSIGHLSVTLENRATAGLVEAVGYLSIAASPMVIGTGMFLLLFGWIDPATLALPLTALVNAAISLPFALRVLVPALQEAETAHGRLSRSLGINGMAYFRLILWPCIRPAAGFAAGLSAALSIGDLGVIALFANPDQATLPLVLYRLLAAYKIEAAQGTALLLLGLSLSLFWFFDRGGRGHVNP